MARGKYEARAKVRAESNDAQRIRDLTAQVKELEVQLGHAKHEADMQRAELNSKAMHAAAKLDADEKQALRDSVAELEANRRTGKVRAAVLAYEVAFRAATGRSPSALYYMELRQLPVTPKDVEFEPVLSAEGSRISEILCGHPDRLMLLIGAALDLNSDEFTELYSLLISGTNRDAKRLLPNARQASAKRLATVSEQLDRLWTARLASKVVLETNETAQEVSA